MARISILYSFFYNSVQAFGWANALFKIVVDFLTTKSVNVGYSSVGELICLLQILAIIGVIHGDLGIVPSGFMFPLMQWGGKTHFLLAIVRRIHEIIRYPFYALSCLGNCPSFLTYLRYTAFIVIYPVRVIGENYFAAIPFSYYTFVKAVLICYPILRLQMYLYLFKQQRSKLRPHGEKGKKRE